VYLGGGGVVFVFFWLAGEGDMLSRLNSCRSFVYIKYDLAVELTVTSEVAASSSDLDLKNCSTSGIDRYCQHGSNKVDAVI
jgi:hypothetical protein